MWLNFHCWHDKGCAECGNSFRIFSDHHDSWGSTSSVIQFLAQHRQPFWGPDPMFGWPDPGMQGNASKVCLSACMHIQTCMFIRKRTDHIHTYLVCMHACECVGGCVRACVRACVHTHACMNSCTHSDFIFTGGQGCAPRGKIGPAGLRCPGQSDVEYLTEYSIWAERASFFTNISVHAESWYGPKGSVEIDLSFGNP